VRSRRQIEDNLASRAEQVIDARSRERFEGRAAEPRPGLRAGHIPGSRNVPYGNLIDAATATMKSPAALRTAFETGRRRARPAAVTSLRLRRLGRRADAGTLPPGVFGSALYDGSWAEWACRMARRWPPARPDRRQPAHPQPREDTPSRNTVRSLLCLPPWRRKHAPLRHFCKRLSCRSRQTPPIRISGPILKIVLKCAAIAHNSFDIKDLVAA